MFAKFVFIDLPTCYNKSSFLQVVVLFLSLVEEYIIQDKYNSKMICKFVYVTAHVCVLLKATWHSNTCYCLLECNCILSLIILDDICFCARLKKYLC